MTSGNAANWSFVGDSSEALAERQDKKKRLADRT
jgi:hypothetical protein